MAFSFSAAFSQSSFSYISTFSHTRRRNPRRFPYIQAVKSSEPANQKLVEAKTQVLQRIPNLQHLLLLLPSPKSLYIVYLSVGHPPYYKGLVYIYGRPWRGARHSHI